jgi:hypothetical protein
MESSRSKESPKSRSDLFARPADFPPSVERTYKMESSARDRKRDSARKKSEFSVYSQKAVRAKENLCAAQVKNATKTKEHLKTKNGS